MYLKGLAAAFALSLAVAGWGAESPQTQAHKIAKPPTIDGTINEDEWREVPFVEGLFDAVTGAAYADSGRFWLAYDKDFIYFAARLQESDPHSIHATEYRTNVGLTGDDYVELDLDLSGSMSAVNTFQINPQGATNIQIAGGRAAKREWIGSFVAKARITPAGWEAEARIPWQAMTIPRGGKRDVRFNILRFIAKNQRRFSYVFIPPTQPGLAPTWAGVELPKPAVDRSIKLLPYTYLGYDPATKGVLNAGLDMKTALADQINLVGSINPDFRNIENQILSIDFSRFERLAGETRPFFQEGQLYSNSQIFASQRIRGFDAGLNTYGRLTDTTSFSLVSTADFGHEADTIFNVTHDPDPNTSIRVTATDLERPGLSNKVYLARLSRNFGAFNLFARDMGSEDSITGTGRQTDLDLTYAKGNLDFFGGWARSAKQFDPRLGFVQEVDFVGPTFQTDYARTYDKGKIQDWGATLSALSYNHTDNSFYRKEYFGQVQTTLRPGFAIVTSADLADFEGSKDSLYTVQLAYPRGNPYKNVGVRIDSGRQAGIAYKSATMSGSYRFQKKLQVTLRQQSVEYGGHSDQTILTGNYDLGNDRSVSGRLVRQGHSTNAYVAYRRSGNEGVEYFLILGDPNATSYRNSLILKVAIPLRIGHKGVDIGAGPTIISSEKTS